MRKTDSASTEHNIFRPDTPAIKFIPETYECPICNKGYSSYEDALSCYMQVPAFAPVSVGQIVRESSFKYGWFDGDEAWIADRRPAKTPSGQEYRVWFVVTAVNLPDPRQSRTPYHEWIISLNTLAIGQYHGWTGLRHTAFEIVEDHEIPQAVKDSAALVPHELELNLL
ncbi:hypothetical protein [Serratia fonticola]|uniref:hypothetical protein n=1 Tax=Serratia fonticola TaxID=47917 RepID=UPI0015C68E02|nr:hypothetical protein [Serratia fonticola]NYA15728.1 hypothetical protein [Serratia fonticola]NYA35848.1 hypothetical protein [Serratia fonticola]